MSKFQKIEFYKASNSAYSLLPFRFTALDAHRYVVTNMAGEYLVTSRDKIQRLIQHQLPYDDPAYLDFRSRHFLVDNSTSVAPDLLAIKVRTKHARLADFTALHMFVVSLRCEHSCPYCQVSRQSEDKLRYDMTPEIASKALDLVFRSPAANIKIEFQGGEPLLNFELIQFIVVEAQRRNELAQRNLAFVIATNLALITTELLDFCAAHGVSISTSLDGPKDLHNANRPRPGKNSYEKAIEGINLVRDRLGRHEVSALMTTTERSLGRVIDIVDEYVARSFNGIFLRPLSPYGFAVKTKSYRAYNAERWMAFYKEGLDYIIDLNRQGIAFTEYYASTILKKMLTSDDSAYVDLMSPAGIGIAGIIYNYDGSVYASDESRMLAEMGVEEFKLGNVLENSYAEIFTSEKLLAPLEESFAYSVPMCNDCAFEPYCGSDPVFHYGLYKDYVGRKPESEFCYRNMETFRFLIDRMESDPFTKRLFTQWANT